MRTLAVCIASAVVVGGAWASRPASAAPGEHLNWGHELRASETSCPSGDKRLDVAYKITNSVDSGTGTNDFGAPWWAVIDYVLQVHVVELDTDVFCASVKTQGSFESVGGDGPGCANESSCGVDAGHLEPGVVGTFQGGYTETFSGSFSPDGMRTKGSIGTFDHDCDPTVGSNNCDGAGVIRWLGLYFTAVENFDFDEWWGWVYHAGNNGSWINEIDDNEGNITGG